MKCIVSLTDFQFCILLHACFVISSLVLFRKFFSTIYVGMAHKELKDYLFLKCTQIVYPCKLPEYYNIYLVT